jgi:hypothetical protein
MIRFCAAKRTLCLALVLFLVVSGCGKMNANRSAIRGEVKLNGQLLEQGSILFSPIEGTSGTVTGGRIEQGRYQLSAANGPAIGTNRVEIRVPRTTGKMVPRGLGATGKMVEEQIEAVAPQFNTASTLRIEIKPGDNVGNFEVTSK